MPTESGKRELVVVEEMEAFQNALFANKNGLKYTDFSSLHDTKREDIRRSILWLEEEIERAKKLNPEVTTETDRSLAREYWERKLTNLQSFQEDWQRGRINIDTLKAESKKTKERAKAKLSELFSAPNIQKSILVRPPGEKGLRDAGAQDGTGSIRFIDTPSPFGNEKNGVRLGNDLRENGSTPTGHEIGAQQSINIPSATPHTGIVSIEGGQLGGESLSNKGKAMPATKKLLHKPVTSVSSSGVGTHTKTGPNDTVRNLRQSQTQVDKIFAELERMDEKKGIIVSKDKDVAWKGNVLNPEKAYTAYIKFDESTIVWGPISNGLRPIYVLLPDSTGARKLAITFWLDINQGISNLVGPNIKDLKKIPFLPPIPEVITPDHKKS